MAPGRSENGFVVGVFVLLLGYLKRIKKSMLLYYIPINRQAFLIKENLVFFHLPPFPGCIFGQLNPRDPELDGGGGGRRERIQSLFPRLLSPTRKKTRNGSLISAMKRVACFSGKKLSLWPNWVHLIIMILKLYYYYTLNNKKTVWATLIVPEHLIFSVILRYIIDYTYM